MHILDPREALGNASKESLESPNIPNHIEITNKMQPIISYYSNVLLTFWHRSFIFKF
jgi:hypothetical protein